MERMLAEVGMIGKTHRGSGRFDALRDIMSFDTIRVRIASPKKILAWSYGQVKKPETINYRSFKPERDGLFCARIFGPTKDWECNCGKYRRMKHRGIVCDKCGVEVIQSKVRRERMGHIELASPVAHIWFLKSIPSRIGAFLDMSVRQLESVLYFEAYVVLDPMKSGFRKGELLSEEQYQEFVQKQGAEAIRVSMGAEALQELLKVIDLDILCNELRQNLAAATSVIAKKKLTKQLYVVEAFRSSGNRPEWMIMDVVPVLPPELRPLVPLDGGRFATSDLNDLYRRVINRNNRLKRLMELSTPEIIVRNEKRMLQEAVDALFDNGRRGRPIRGTNKRPLKSLADMLRGKQGRFRQNLLGKRVDYSGRSVVVVEPTLKLHQCGLPKKMALELFKPFIFQKLEERGYAITVRNAKKYVEREQEEVWDVLEEVVSEYPILLNRAPTLHRLGIQAFDPILVEGKAIRLHPLVCAVFNADFDGDQMAVHVPVSIEAQIESRVLMMSINNILSPAHGKPVMVPTQDMVLGCYWLTKEQNGAKGTGGIFSSVEEVRMAYDRQQVDAHARITLRMGTTRVETTVGRALLSDVLPQGMDYALVNKVMTKKDLTALVEQVCHCKGRRETVLLLDALKGLGFQYATKAGISICIDDMHIPARKGDLIKKAEREVLDIESQYAEGLITKGESYNKRVDIWVHLGEQIAGEMMKGFSQAEEDVRLGIGPKGVKKQFNSIFMMADSGARGSAAQIRQLCGMRGLMAKPSGEIIETPITANFREGLTVAQYFISTHGARKGLADTALKTANSGYLTRRLVDVSQDVTISVPDCHTTSGIFMSALLEGGEVIQQLEERLYGRIAAENIEDPITQNCICPADTALTMPVIKSIMESGLDQIKIRSVLTCESPQGVCAKCYGYDLSQGKLVERGEAVGVIAAQSIGEPGTQLTMRTFHIGGTASKAIEQTVLEAKNTGILKYLNLNIVKNEGGDRIVMNRNGRVAICDESGREKERYSIVYGAKIKIEEGVRVETGHKIAEWDPYAIPILTEVGGKVAWGDLVEGKTVREEVDEVTGLSRKVVIDHPGTSLRPRISIKDTSGKTAKGGSATLGRYMLPSGVHILVEAGQVVVPGDVLAKIPRETTKTKDITGGLPRVAELFEARRPKEHAVISEIDGVVEYGGFIKGMRKVIIRNDVGDVREYLVSKGKHVNVREGDSVNAGEPLVDGPVNPHDVLAILGPHALQKYLVDEIQKVYHLQGVSISDKHIEVIVRQMLKKVRIEEPGDTSFFTGAQVDRMVFVKENEVVLSKGGRPAVGQPILLGITKAALSTNSFVSAASFQETTRVLTEAAISGRADHLVSLKENVIVGRLIPAGSGFSCYTDTYVCPPEESVAEENEVAVAQ